MQYNVQGPDGQQHVIEGPDGASDDEVISQAQKLFTVQQPANPKWYELEKQQGLPTSIGGAVKQIGSTVLNAATSPFPMPGKEVLDTTSQLANQTGATVAKTLASQSPIMGRLAGFGAATALNPISYAGAGLGPEAEAGAIAKPGILQKVFNLFKKPATDEELSGAVSNVQDMVSGAKKTFGDILNKAKSDIGIPTSVPEREASLQQYGNVYGLGKDTINKETQDMLDSKSAEELAASIAKFKSISSSTTSDPALSSRVASALQDKINNFVDWDKTGDATQGVLKQQYKDLGDIVTKGSQVLSDAKSKMSTVLDNVNFISKKIGDPGQATAFLKRIYTNPTGKNADYLTAIRNIEGLTGKETIDELFNKFASQDQFNLYHPVATATKSTFENAGSLIRSTPRTLAGPAASGFKLFNTPDMQSIRDKLRSSSAQ